MGALYVSHFLSHPNFKCGCNRLKSFLSCSNVASGCIRCKTFSLWLKCCKWVHHMWVIFPLTLTLKVGLTDLSIFSLALKLQVVAPDVSHFSLAQILQVGAPDVSHFPSHPNIKRSKLFLSCSNITSGCTRSKSFSLLL